jgi:hypothetical protein
VFYWLYKDILGIDHHIFQHDIQTFENVKPVRKKLQLVNPRKVAAIKTKVEKLLKSIFIHLVLLMEWFSNLVLVDKKQGTICVCTDFRYLNTPCLKDNFPMQFIDQILDEWTC